MKKSLIVLQEGNKDCGASCLLSVVRYYGGNISKEKIIERFTTAYKEVNEKSKYNYVVINDKVLDAVQKVEAIMLSEKCRVDRIEDVDLNNREELIHELLINEDL